MRIGRVCWAMALVLGLVSASAFAKEKPARKRPSKAGNVVVSPEAAAKKPGGEPAAGVVEVPVEKAARQPAVEAARAPVGKVADETVESASSGDDGWELDTSAEVSPPSAVEASQPSAGALLFHWPVSEARSDRKGLSILARWDGEWNGQALRLHWRQGDNGSWNWTLFVTRRGKLEARIPPQDVTAPGISYWIESVEADGTSRARFGSQEAPQVVRVARNAREQRMKERLEGHEGHRYRVEAVFRHADFGTNSPGGRSSEDNFNEFRIGFTYRPLLAGLYQAEIGFLMVADRMGFRTTVPVHSVKPGAYLAYLKLYWEFSDVFGIEPLLMLGASHQGLEPGGGITFRVGALRSTHLDIGIQGARTLGWSFVTELDVLVARFMRVRVRNELTNWPTNAGYSFHDDGIAPYGILPAIGLAFMLPGGVEVNGSIGYGIRKGYDRGWIHGSVGLAVEF